MTQAHDAYRWICGGVRVNYHNLSDCCTAHTEALEGLPGDSVAALMAAGAVTLKRAATAECVNALARQRGLLRLRVRGTGKVRGVLPMYALAHNLMRTFALAPELLGCGVGAPSGIAMEK